MIPDKKKFNLGIVLFALFIVVLVIFFSPVFNGKNGLAYLDDLYNSISKGSAYYIPNLREEIRLYADAPLNLTLSLKTSEQARETASLFAAGDANVHVDDSKITLSGDLKKVLENCLADADSMYVNDGEKLAAKYGLDERKVLFNWWQALQRMDVELSKQKKFKEAKIVSLINKKAVETSYNYYTIEPQKISDRWGVVILSLIFYVVYTLWYGFAIMFLFEGWGMKLGH